MNIRDGLIGVSGAIGVTALANAVLPRLAGDLPPPLPGTELTYRWRGIEVSYTELGMQNDQTILLLHGVHAAGSSHEFEPIATHLAEEYHVVAPDLPGFGSSERPPIEYDAELYTDFVREFAADVAPGAVCLASSLTGSYAALTQRETGVFSKLILVCPTATTMGIRNRTVRTLLRSPLIGTALFNLLASKWSIRHFNADHSFFDPGAIESSHVDYEWRTAHQPGARFAPASFISGYLDPGIDLGEALAMSHVPITLIWGREADIAPLSYGRDLAEEGDARLVVFDNARLLPHVEHSDEFVDVLNDDLTITP